MPPSPRSTSGRRAALTLPVVVETSAFTTEVILCNVSPASATVRLSYVADAIQAADSTASISITLGAGEQKVIPSFVQYLRSQGVPGVGAPGSDVRGRPVPDRRRAGPGGRLPGRPDADRRAAADSYGLFYTAIAQRSDGHVRRLALRPPAERREPHEPRARQHGRDGLEHGRPPRRPLRRSHRVDREVVRRLARAEEVDADQRRPVAGDRERLRAHHPDERHEPVPGLRGRRGRRRAPDAQRRRRVREPSRSRSRRRSAQLLAIRKVEAKAKSLASRASRRSTTSAAWRTSWPRCPSTR